MNNNLLLKHVNIIDGVKNSEVKEDYDILILNGVITKIEKDIKADCKQIDLKGKFIMPGLINAHVHLPGSGKPKNKKSPTKEKVNKLLKIPFVMSVLRKLCYSYALLELKSGVTTIRTVGGLRDIDSQIRDSINNGKKVGPRMLVSNTALTVTGGHMAGVLAYTADTLEDVEKTVLKIIDTKPDLIKLMITGGVLDATKKGEPGVLRMQLPLVQKAVEIAHKHGYKVAAHVESVEGVKVALEAYVDTIEHGADIDEELLMLMKKNNSRLITTISPSLPLADFDKEVTHSNDLLVYNANVVKNGIISNAKSCISHNMPIGLGTDTACPFVTHYDTYRELLYFVKYLGLTPLETIHIATLQNAEILEIADKTGSIEVGKSADLLILNESPITNLKTLALPFMVIKEGNVIKNIKIKKYPYVEKMLNTLL